MGGVGRMAGNGEVRTGHAGGKVAGRPGSPGGETPISAFLKLVSCRLLNIFFDIIGLRFPF